MSIYTLEFEKNLKDLEDKIIDLNKNNSVSLESDDTITSLKYQIENEKKRIYNDLTRWQRIQIARHPLRPHTSDYIEILCTEWIEIHGDRKFADDPSIISGISSIDGIKCVIVGQEKGR